VQPPDSHQVNQSYPAVPQPQEEANRYAFFMESKPKNSSPFPALPRKMSPLMLIAGGAVLLLIVIGLVAVLLSSFKGPGGDTAVLFDTIIKDQQEIIRVDELASDKVTSTSTKNFIATSELTAISRQKQFEDYASAHKIKVQTKNLDNYIGDPQTDEALKAAEAASTYDSSFTTIMSQMLSKYENDLKKLSSRAVNDQEQALVQESSDDITLLEKMLTQQ
jgi:hypothetical protein